MATHQFDVDLAVKYGVNAAVILNHIAFWVKTNESKKVNFFEGRYWTYNSVRAFNETFPYLGVNQIRQALNKLVADGMIQKGNYNKAAYDRTTWYALTEKSDPLFKNAFADNHKSIYQKSQMEVSEITNGFTQNHKSIYPKSQMDLPKITNPFAENHEPIPDIKPYINTDNNTDNKRIKKGYAAIVEKYTQNTDLSCAIFDFVEQRKANKSPMTDRALEMMLNKLDTLASTDSEKIKILNEATANGWKSVYPLKQTKNEKKIEHGYEEEF